MLCAHKSNELYKKLLDIKGCEIIPPKLKNCPTQIPYPNREKPQWISDSV